MSEFVPGQRWANDAELALGLGVVLAVEYRTISLLFHASGETRTYAKDTAPLTRIRFDVGDQITDIHKRSLKVIALREDNHLITYQVLTEAGQQEWLEERDLDTSIKLNKPLQRLLAGQSDDNHWFELRLQTWQYQLQQFNHPLKGLIGPRTSLIPHQLYIAQEVASRYAPRVLLADEVGLGKTIEAGLILHHQINSGRAGRVLIIVPEPLINQWLVELLRRFNLFFSIYDEERCQAIEQSSGFENPFQAEQWVLCSLPLFTHNPARFEQVIETDWDLLIVDEAHHLQWQAHNVSLEYELIERLSRLCKGLLLLTATPEQFGKQSHFARLRLLDPDRFSDYDSFIQQESHYQAIADLIDALKQQPGLTQQQLQQLHSFNDQIDIRALGQGEIPAPQRQQIMHQLLDCHGTGRVLFRNTRAAIQAAIQGFPERKLIAHPLPLAPEYLPIVNRAAQPRPGIEAQLHPEQAYRDAPSSNSGIAWTAFDPRFAWLVKLLDQLRDKKILLITHYAATAIDLSRALKTHYAIASSVFHEKLSIVERDKRAADFADKESGVQLLLCSEIGSEGRNFQFAHHLVLFDLPLNPDLLEQRIGRLDRIGQTQTIHIHVPYFEHSTQHRLLDWYHLALNAFNNTCPAGAAIFSQFKTRLMQSLDTELIDGSAFSAFIEECRDAHSQLQQQMHEGRDRLLEYSSCRSDIAAQLVDEIQAFEQASPLQQYMQNVFDCYGVNMEEHRSGSYILRPAEHMLGQFPGLSDEGMTVTFDRHIALSHEDMHFLSWDHPMVLNGMDMLLSQEMGNVSAGKIHSTAFKPGQLLVQALYILSLDLSMMPAEVQATLQSQPLQPLPLLLTWSESGSDHSAGFSSATDQPRVSPLDRAITRQLIQLKSAEIKSLNTAMSAALEAQAGQHLLEHISPQLQILQNEAQRLRDLQSINPQVRDEEIEFFESQQQAYQRALDYPLAQLDSLRLIITT